MFIRGNTVHIKYTGIYINIYNLLFPRGTLLKGCKDVSPGMYTEPVLSLHLLRQMTLKLLPPQTYASPGRVGAMSCWCRKPRSFPEKKVMFSQVFISHSSVMCRLILREEICLCYRAFASIPFSLMN